jgi:hypothetical protein
LLFAAFEDAISTSENVVISSLGKDSFSGRSDVVVATANLAGGVLNGDTVKLGGVSSELGGDEGRGVGGVATSPRRRAGEVLKGVVREGFLSLPK